MKKALNLIFLTFCFFIINSCLKSEIYYTIQDTPIIVDMDVDPLVYWAVEELAKDIEKITGKRPNIIKTRKVNITGIIVGQSTDNVVKNTLSENDTIQTWETFSIKKRSNSLIITGSDVRGTVYGVFEVAERLGISPWHWWADVSPEKKEKLVLELPKEDIIQKPSVKYRGIFLNDEDWGLQPWAAKTFESEVGDIGPKTYEKIFQLLLRLKANTIWPAMHPSTKAFYSIYGNKEMAQKYHIVIGSSHAEPMLRNNVSEWNHDAYGDYNYFTNNEQINTYWETRISEVSNAKNKTIMTLGMRGIHDSHMQGAETIVDNVKKLEEIFATQRSMLSLYIKRPITKIPQVFVPYKEVLELYNNNLYVPEDVTLMWTDDNYGYIRRLSNEEEQKRAGGSGVYYHLSYWGRPHDYLWLSTTQPGLIWYEMTKAYQNGARDMWIANVGDIKPAEYNMEFFLDLAWNIDSINENTIHKHLKTWTAREFGDQIAEETAEVMQTYYQLAFLRKPEYMGWGQTERTTPNTISEFTNEEALLRIARYKQLVDTIDRLEKNVSKNRKAAWFQLVAYPVKAAANMNFKFLNWQLASQSKDTQQQKASLEASQQAYQNIKALTTYYNTTLKSGKWAHMMSMEPRNLPVFNDVSKERLPNYDSLKHKTSKGRIIIPVDSYVSSEGFNDYTWKPVKGLGYSNTAITLFPFKHSYFNKEKPWISYEFVVKEAGDYNLEIRLLPTHANNFDHNIAVQVNNNSIQNFAINTKGRSAAWKTNVLRNSAIVDCNVSNLKAGTHQFKIFVNQTGIVLDQLAISPSNSPDFYEIPLATY